MAAIQTQTVLPLYVNAALENNFESPFHISIVSIISYWRLTLWTCPVFMKMVLWKSVTGIKKSALIGEDWKTVPQLDCATKM